MQLVLAGVLLGAAGRMFFFEGALVAWLVESLASYLVGLLVG